MRVKGLAWLGTRTAQFEPMVAFCQNMLGLTTTHPEPGFVVFDMPNGDLLEIFGADSPFNTFMTHPVAGFLVDDIVATRTEMEAYGIEFIGPIEKGRGGHAWSSFRAPDGFVYELTYGPRRLAKVGSDE